MFIVNPKNYRKSIGKLMQNNKNLTASLENYLKAIFNIVKEKKAARVKDISKQLNIGASSVSEALRTLSERNLINYEPYGIITLTEAGLDKAEALLKRHDIIKNFFENVLSVSSELSEESASQVEHVIPDEVMKKFVMFLIKKNINKRSDSVKQFCLQSDYKFVLLIVVVIEIVLIEKLIVVQQDLENYLY